ncbi:hypothetical protein AAHA92_03151 [Salvia divinorum]|uniref:Uncharacterized protein n=1 Tax=Salvia divinorum TaxID=28513 RepID=A0ABD1IIV1_SALDI
MRVFYTVLQLRLMILKHSSWICYVLKKGVYIFDCTPVTVKKHKHSRKRERIRIEREIDVRCMRKKLAI